MSNPFKFEPNFDPETFLRDEELSAFQELQDPEDPATVEELKALLIEPQGHSREFVAAIQGLIERIEQLPLQPGERRREYFPSAVRAAVWEMTNGRCFYCGRWTNPFETFEIDHIRPWSQHGSDDISNLVPCCTRCNRSKSDQSLSIWRHLKLVQDYHLGTNGNFGLELASGPLWFETEDFRSAGYDSRREFIVREWKKGRRSFHEEFGSWPRYGVRRYGEEGVPRIPGLLYDLYWDDDEEKWRSWFSFR